MRIDISEFILESWHGIYKIFNFEVRKQKWLFSIGRLHYFNITEYFFAIYPINYRYYELSKSTHYADYVGIVFFLSILLFLIVTGLFLSIKRQNLKWFKFTIQVVKTIFFMVIFHYLFFRPITSGAMLFVNNNLGRQEPYFLRGYVVGKIEYSGSRTSRYELYVKQQGTDNIIVLKTHKPETDKYKVNDTFERNMQKGCFNLLYLGN